MKALKMGLLATVAGALLGISGGVIHSRTVAAQSVTPNPGIASVACAAAQGNWTDCTVTLSQGILAGGSIAASLAGTDAVVAYCASGIPDGDGDVKFCGINGNTAVFLFPQGGMPGEQLQLSARGSSNAALAQSLTVSASGVYSQAPNQSGLALIAPGARLPSE
ncbi:MAG TPA: hypothetical protein VK821_06560 [Dehalococcoidia bacterium]|nr:hypothetical protein [Dehalococcoidia bacterium]